MKKDYSKIYILRGGPRENRTPGTLSDNSSVETTQTRPSVATPKNTNSIIRHLINQAPLSAPGVSGLNLRHLNYHSVSQVYDKYNSKSIKNCG